MTNAITGLIWICVIFGMPIAGLLIGLLGWPRWLYDVAEAQVARHHHRPRRPFGMRDHAGRIHLRRDAGAAVSLPGEGEAADEHPAAEAE